MTFPRTQEEVNETKTPIVPLCRPESTAAFSAAASVFATSRVFPRIRGDCSVRDRHFKAIYFHCWVENNDWPAWSCPCDPHRPPFSHPELFLWSGHHRFLCSCFGLSIFAHGVPSAWRILLLVLFVLIVTSSLGCYVNQAVMWSPITRVAPCMWWAQPLALHTGQLWLSCEKLQVFLHWHIM